MTNSLNTPIEALEYAYPFRVVRYGYRPGSGGQGRFTGGDGLVREIELLTDGQVTLTEFARNHPTMYLASAVEEFHQVAPIASAQGISVVNGGYTYDAELVSLLPQVLPGVIVEALDAGVIAAALDPVPPGEELSLARLLGIARGRLDPLDCDVILRAFRPVTMPALFLDSRAARAERTRAEIAASADNGTVSTMIASRTTDRTIDSSSAAVR